MQNSQEMVKQLSSASKFQNQYNNFLSEILARIITTFFLLLNYIPLLLMLVSKETVFKRIKLKCMIKSIALEIKEPVLCLK